MALESLARYQDFSPSVLRLIATLKVVSSALPPATISSATQQESDELTRHASHQSHDQCTSNSTFPSSETTAVPHTVTDMFNDAFAFDDLQPFNFEFDPNDISWLMAMPFETFEQF